MRPFDEQEVSSKPPAERVHMREFNRRLSSIRIKSEHAFGLLKGCFPALKEMGRHENIQDAFKAIEALMIIHNICIDWKNRPDRMWDFDPTDDWSDDEEVDADVGGVVIVGEAHVPAHETNAWLKEKGREKRDVVFNQLFPG